MFGSETRKPQDMVNLILGLCLFASPWVIGFVSNTMPTRNAWVIGVAMALVALAALSALAEWEEWLNLLFGAWLIISPWVLGFAGDANAMWTHVIIGALAAVVSAWGVWEYRHEEHPA